MNTSALNWDEDPLDGDENESISSLPLLLLLLDDSFFGFSPPTVPFANLKPYEIEGSTTRIGFGPGLFQMGHPIRPYIFGLAQVIIKTITKTLVYH